VITGFALWLVWRGGAAGQGDRLLLGWAALGFSIWQFSDVVIFHWIIGIHRIRVDVENPLLWDLGWLMVFAVPSLFLAVWLLRKEGGPGVKSRPGFARPTLTLVALFAILLSALAPSSRSTVVVFRPSVTPSEAFAAAASINARILWSDSRGGALALDVPETENPWKLYWRGAIFVSAGAFTAPCAALLRT
jgi:hypothetical protein